MSQHENSLLQEIFGRMHLPTLRQLWMVLPFFILLLKGLLFPLPLLDFWWHLKMGQVILDTGSIPRMDLFSYTAAGKTFIVQNWLGEVVLYLTYRAGGFPLLVFMNSLLLVLALIPVFYLCRRSSDRYWAGVLTACLVALCLPCNLRPQIFSYVLFAVFYGLVSSYRREGGAWIWALPCLMVLWVNLHGAFVLGLALIAVIFCADSIRFLLDVSPPDAIPRLQLAKLGLAFGLCAVATLANPETFGVYRYILTVVNDPSSRQFVAEWQPPAVSSIQGIVQFYLPFFLTTLILMISNRRPTLTEMALYAGFAAFGLTATRNAVWFLFVSAPILARHLSSIHWSSVLASRCPGSQSNSSSLQPWVHKRKEHYSLNVAIAGFALVVLSVQSPWAQQRLHPNALFDSNTPIGAVDYIERESLVGNIFHPQSYGDYLIWRLWPKQRSFFDGRVHLFGEPLVRAYQQIYNDSHGEEALKDYDVRFLLLSKAEEKAEDKNFISRIRRSGDWKLLYEDDVSALYEKVQLHDP